MESDEDVEIISAEISQIEIPETDDESDSDVVIINSDSEDETDKRVERSCISPSSRRSITGIQPSDIESDDSDYDFERLTPPSQKHITQENYVRELEHKQNLVEKIEKYNKLLVLQSKLPDNGANIRKKTSEIRKEVEAITEKLKNSTIKDNKKPKETTWAEIQKKTEEVEPIHMGKQGLATFNKQKTLTVDRLENLHRSLATCPPENTKIDQPKALKITLMDHQSYGLAWMLWRERGEPHGGILADDMGLGKTLSMIALILKAAELDGEVSLQENSKRDSAGENVISWVGRGRKDFYDGGTLVVCPASLINQWYQEINQHVVGDKMKCCMHHGAKREKLPRVLAKFNVVITTYAIVIQEHKNKGTLFGVKWDRLVLDEAHVTRNYKSKMSEAVCQLNGNKRWALTGTPIQNKELDVYALFKFLKCSPFDDLAVYKKWISNKTTGGESRLNTIMQTILLRRTKIQLQEKGVLNSLPTKKIELIEVNLDNMEMNVYQKVMLYSKTIFAQYLQQKQEKENNYFNPIFKKSADLENVYSKMHEKLSELHGNTSDDPIKSSTILTLLLRLRQICCHPGLVHSMLDKEEAGDISMDDVEQLNLMEHMNRMKLKDTANGVVVDDNETVRSANAIAKASAKIMLPSNPVFDFGRRSSKIVEILKFVEEKIRYTNDKAIIVSQWTSFLDIIADNLDAIHVPYNQLNGKVPVKARNDLVIDLNKLNSGPKIMLLSLTAGGVGLNLVGANYLLLTDLHWNPQLEAQAQDRIYRVGQKKPVTIYKFICTDTVEQKIKLLQDKKLDIANSVLTGASHSGSKLSMADLKSLFDL